MYCAWEARWGRNLNRRKVGKVWSPGKRQVCSTCHRKRAEALNASFSLFLPSWFSRSSSGGCHITQYKRCRYPRPWAEVLVPPPHPVCTSAVVNCTHGAACPSSEESLEIRVWKPSSWEWRVVSWNVSSGRATPKLSPFSIWSTCSCNHVVTRLTAWWHPWSWVSGAAGRAQSSPCHSLDYGEDLCIHLPLLSFHPFFLLLSLPLLLLFPLEWIRYQDIQQGLQIAQVGFIES